MMKDLTLAASIMMLDYDSHVDLTAPLTGDMAGLLFFQDRKTVLLSGYHDIRSKDARRLVGTMYFPNAKLMVEARNPVADKSEYTVIIAKEFELRDGPDLVLKTDYGATPIPLPDGVGNKAHPTVRLTK